MKDSELYRLRAEDAERVARSARLDRAELLAIAERWRTLENLARQREAAGTVAPPSGRQ
jgi:hypothetical protein